MPSFLEAIASRWDPVGVMRASRVRIGKSIRAQGVPAILMGVSCVVLVAGAVRALSNVGPALSEGLREARLRLEATRRRSLNP